VILIRRVYTERMQYSHTEYDVRDRTLRNLLSEIHRDTKGIEVTDSHIQVIRFCHCPYSRTDTYTVPGGYRDSLLGHTQAISAHARTS
jgi:hypothetical protein